MPEYRTLGLKEIKLSKFNPSRRVTRDALTGLILSIREHGILQPLVLDQNGVLADGHRRLAAAKVLKLDRVPVAIYNDSPLDAQELWVVLNGDTLNLTPAQWLSAVRAGLSLDTPGFPERLKDRIIRLQRLISSDEMEILVFENRSPMILDAAERTLRYLGKEMGDEAFLRTTLSWLIRTGNAWAIKGAMHDEVPKDILEEAILHGKKIGRIWDMVE